MSRYGPEMRERLCASLRSVGTPGSNALIAVDLACHAAEAAWNAYSDVINRAPDGPVILIASEIGSQLARAEFDRIFKAVHGFAAASGFESARVEVVLQP